MSSPVECPKCAAGNPAGKKFCGECGASLDPLSGTINSYLDANLKSRVDEVIKDRFKDQKAMEVEVAAEIAEKLTGWAKLFAAFLALPMALIFVIMGLYGFKELSDVKKAKDEIDRKINESRQAIDDSTKQSEANRVLNAAINEKLQADKQNAERTSAQVLELQRKVQERSAQLDQLPLLTKKVDALEATVDDLTNPASPEIMKKLRREGKVFGIDAAFFSKNIDWDKLREAGVSFAFIRATQGTTHTDAKFADNWSQSKKAGILHGAYHVFVYPEDPLQQAEYFTKTFRQEPGDLPPVFDVEQIVVHTAAAPDDIKKALDNLRTLTEAVHKKTGCNPIIATDSFWRERFSSSAPSSFSNNPLWIRTYSTSAEPFPPWTKWTFWQFSNMLSINGLRPYDFSAYDGSYQQLQEFAKQQCTHQ